MSNNAHDLSNRLLNALDNNYNVSLLVLKMISPITNSEIRKRPAQACVTRFELRFCLLGGCFDSNYYHLMILRSLEALVTHGSNRIPRCWKKSFVPVDTWAIRVRCTGPLTSPALVPPSLVPNVLQCESMELCHAWPFP